MDNRLLDIPLSEPFYKWMTGSALGLEDLLLINPSLATSLLPLAQLCVYVRENVIPQLEFLECLSGVGIHVKNGH